MLQIVLLSTHNVKNKSSKFEVYGCVELNFKTSVIMMILSRENGQQSDDIFCSSVFSFE